MPHARLARSPVEQLNFLLHQMSSFKINQQASVTLQVTSASLCKYNQVMLRVNALGKILRSPALISTEPMPDASQGSVEANSFMWMGWGEAAEQNTNLSALGE